MIRLLVFLIGLIIVWLMFFSGLDKRVRIIASIVLALGLLLALWVEDAGKNPRSGIMQPTEVSVCGVEGEFSYRSNYNISVCLRNETSDSEVRRVQMVVTALTCDGANCEEMESVAKAVTVTLLPGEQTQTVQNMRFDKLRSLVESADSAAVLRWVVQIDRVWALD